MTKLDSLVQTYGLQKLDSLTKYPSILTYHQMGNKGGVTKELTYPEFNCEDLVDITEKVDGTNARCVYLDGDYFIGSRDSLVYAKGDRIITSVLVNPVLKGLKEYLDSNRSPYHLVVMFGEVYGSKIGDGSKIYCSKGGKEVGFRLFDVWSMDIGLVEMTLEKSIEEIVRLRNAGCISWYSKEAFDNFCNHNHIERTPRRIKENILAGDIPKDPAETKAWLEKHFKNSLATFGSEGSNLKYGRAEGIVVRTYNRSVIKKLRFEDYDRGEMKGWV